MVDVPIPTVSVEVVQSNNHFLPRTVVRNFERIVGFEGKISFAGIILIRVDKLKSQLRCSFRCFDLQFQGVRRPFDSHIGRAGQLKLRTCPLRGTFPQESIGCRREAFAFHKSNGSSPTWGKLNSTGNSHTIEEDELHRFPPHERKVIEDNGSRCKITVTSSADRKLKIKGLNFVQIEDLISADSCPTGLIESFSAPVISPP